MFKPLLIELQNRISAIAELKYTDENWGQIDYYSPNMPVQWPCALIDIQSAQFSNIGKDFSKNPQARQMGQVLIKITLANLKLSPTSARTTAVQKQEAWHVMDLLESIHQQLHDHSPLPNCSKLLRQSFQRIIRDDGVQEYAVYYACELANL